MISAWKWRHLNGVAVYMKLVPLSSQNTVEFTVSLPFSQHSRRGKVCVNHIALQISSAGLIERTTHNAELYTVRLTRPRQPFEILLRMKKYENYFSRESQNIQNFTY